jgi:hypothetical protein
MCKQTGTKGDTICDIELGNNPTVGNTLNNDIVIFMPDNAYRTASTSTIAPELAPLTPSFIEKTLSAIRSSGGSDRSF